MTSDILLILSISWILASLFALVRLHRSGPLSFPIMMIGWLVGDHPSGNFLAQVLTAAALTAGGALDADHGWLALALAAVSWVGLAAVRRTSRLAAPTAETALLDALGTDYRADIDPQQLALMESPVPRPVMKLNARFRLTGLEAEFDIPYGKHPKRNLLDIYRPKPGAENAPVLLQVHGGGWIIGHKQQQAFPLMLRMAHRGWICVSINYRLAPKHRFPDQIVDVKRAIAWVRANIADHGGDPSTIVLTGGSAGGHLTSLAALTPNLADFQPGFESADTSVAACVPFYGPPDFTNRNKIRGPLTSMQPFLNRLIMPSKLADDPELWDLVSPLSQINADAPPFFIIQGHHDVLVWKEEARDFVDQLRQVSEEPVAYWEVPGAQHAFDTFPSHRTGVAVDAIERFLALTTTRRGD